jgi:hypothetical protein
VLLDEFLTEYVQGYLFEDLENLSTIQPAPGKRFGAGGYPMLSATLAGMQLLGGLLSPDDFSTKQGDRYFASYWKHMLVPRSPQYGRPAGLPDLVSALVRDGLAHQFITKPGILVVKGAGPAGPHHLEIDADEYGLCLDCIEFFHDFRGSYQSGVVPIARGEVGTIDGQAVTSATMQRRLDQMLALNTRQALRWFDSVRPGWQLESMRPKPSTVTVRATTTGYGSSAPSRTISLCGSLGPSGTPSPFGEPPEPPTPSD